MKGSLQPDLVLEQVAAELPPAVRNSVVIIGSLAAGHHFFGSRSGRFMHTKDVDCLLTPRVAAVDAGALLMQKLLDSGWTFHTEGDHGTPGDSTTRLNDLPAVRLRPPDASAWFLELLTAPDPSAGRDRHWLRIATSHGHFGLPSFGFLSIAAFHPAMTPWGIRVARPSMMALANLLENPVIRPDPMSALLAGRALKRSNKDVGRVLALARLAGDQVVEAWAAEWRQALEAVFPAERNTLAMRLGDGLRQLLASDEDLDQAVVICNAGLLSSIPVTVDQLRATGERLMIDAVRPIERMVRPGR